jgi:hypothetical protein
MIMDFMHLDVEGFLADKVFACDNLIVLIPRLFKNLPSNSIAEFTVLEHHIYQSPVMASASLFLHFDSFNKSTRPCATASLIIPANFGALINRLPASAVSPCAHHSAAKEALFPDGFDRRDPDDPWRLSFGKLCPYI